MFDRRPQGWGISEADYRRFALKNGEALRIGAHEFVTKNGATGADSAVRCGLADPPEPPDGFPCLNNRKLYWTEMLKRLTAAFKEIKKNALDGGVFSIQWPANVAGEQPGGVEACLEKLKKLAADAKKEIKKINKQIAATPEGIAAAEREKANEQRRVELEESRRRADAEAKARFDKVAGMTID